MADGEAKIEERIAAANAKLVRLELPQGAVQLLYDVLGHFPHDPGSWSQDARARCSQALWEVRYEDEPEEPEAAETYQVTVTVGLVRPRRRGPLHRLLIWIERRRG